jgi:uncharacterized OB-fold protein
MTTETLAPIVNDLNRPFWEAAETGTLLMPHCVDSDRPFWPPSPLSPFTSGPVSWRPVEPRGTVAAAVTYARIFQQLLADRTPFAIALVDLVDGVRLQVHAPDPALALPGTEVTIGFAALGPDTRPVPVVA